jgi:epsilon-lactone hydrolase
MFTAIRFAIVRFVLRLFCRQATAKRYLTVRKWEDNLLKKYLRVPKQCVTTPLEVAGVPAEWISWQGLDNGRVILYLHGGGYVLCSTKTHRPLVCRFVRASGARALVIDYRRAPEHPHPAAVEDALAAYRWLLDSGVESSRIAVMGDSAGGGLTLVLLQLLRDHQIPLPACAICLSPWTDLTCSGDSVKRKRRKDPVLYGPFLPAYARLYMPEGDLAQPTASPLFGDFSNLPPILIHVGTDEVLLDDSIRVAEKAAKTNTPVELKVWRRMIHVFQAAASIHPKARQSIQEIGNYIEKQIP